MKKKPAHCSPKRPKKAPDTAGQSATIQDAAIIDVYVNVNFTLNSKALAHDRRRHLANHQRR